MVYHGFHRESKWRRNRFLFLWQCLLAHLCFLQITHVSNGLQFPSTFPSSYYTISRKITIRDWDTMLPLQKYHAMKRPQIIHNKKSSGKHDPIEHLTLEAILQNLTAYDLSHSSISMLEKHESLSTVTRHS